VKQEEVSKKDITNSFFKIGDRVTTVDHLTGTISNIYPDDLIYIKIRDSLLQYNADQLFKPISCLKGFCVNDKVTTVDHYHGTISDIFPDGVIYIKISNSILQYSVDQLFLVK
jgi:preprotein translocase subunit YajC